MTCKVITEQHVVQDATRTHRRQWLTLPMSQGRLGDPGPNSCVCVCVCVCVCARARAHGRVCGDGGAPTPTSNSLDTSCVSYTSTQFWPYLTGGSARSHRLRAQSYKIAPTSQFRCQPQTQLITCASDWPTIDCSQTDVGMDSNSATLEVYGFGNVNDFLSLILSFSFCKMWRKDLL